MTTISGTLVDNSGAPVSRKRIAATLKAATVVTEGGEQIVRDTATLSGTDGTWSLELTPTDNLIFPDGAYYKVWSGEQIWYITVPDNGTHSLETVLVTPVSPDTQFAVTAEQFEAHITEFEALEASDAERVHIADYADDLMSAIFEPAPSFDVPVATWSTGHSTSDLPGAPVQYRPVVCGTGSQTTGWDGRTNPTEPTFLFHSGRFRTQNGAFADLAMYGEIKPEGDFQFARWPIIAEFITSAGVDQLEIGFFDLNVNAPSQVQVEVAGGDAGTFISPGGMGSSRKVRLTWPYAASRWVRLYMTGSMGFYAVRVPEGESLAKPGHTVTRRIAIIGDSYTNGAGVFEGDGGLRGTGSTNTYAVPLLKAMGAQDLILAGIGATGFTAGDNGGTPANYITRIAEVLSFGPSAIIFQGSVNDPFDGSGGDIPAVQAAVEACLAATDSIPERYVMTVMREEWTQVNDAIRAAVAAHGQGVQLVEVEGLIYGTGNALDGGTGNRTTMMLDDNVHPTYLAHRVIARQAFRQIARLMPFD